MLKIEDILDDAVRYLNGQMDAEGKDFFEDLLREFPHLREELRLMNLTKHGLAELKKQDQQMEGPAKRPLMKGRHGQTVFYILASVILLALLSRGAFYFLKGKASDLPEYKNELVIYAHPATPKGNLEGEANPTLTIESFGGDSKSNDTNRGKAVCWMPSGEIAFAGTFAGKGQLGTVSFASAGDRDILFGQYQPGLGFTWVLPCGGKNIADMPRSIAADRENNILVTGNFGGEINLGEGHIYRATGKDDLGNHDFFIAKFNYLGQLQWMDHNGGDIVPYKQTGSNTGLAITTDANDEVIVTGAYIGAPEFGGKKLPIGGPNEDAFLAKYTSDGQLKWVKTITSEYMVYAFDVAVDHLGNIYLSGSFGHHNLSGKAFFEKDTLTSFGGRDIFLAKYSPEGELLWVQQAGSAQNNQGYDEGNSLAIDEAGNCYISGLFVGEAMFGRNARLSSYGGRDIFLAKYDPTGKLIWVQQAGSPGGSGSLNEGAQDIAVTKEGFILMTGSFTETARFGKVTLETGAYSNFFLVSYSPQGDIVWTKQFMPLEGFQAANGMSIDVNESGEFVVTGFLSGAAEIDGKTLKSEGKEIIFLLVFSKAGELVKAEGIVNIA